MKKRLLSILLILCMVLTMLPVTAFAEGEAEELSEESGQTGTSNDAPAITAADVQALIDALPEAETISEDNAADVEAQLEAIDEAKVQLSDEDFAVLDFTRYDAAVAALMALSGEPGAAFTLQASASHSHCICGGSVSAGNHASHSDVAYTAWNGTDGISYTNNIAYVYLTENAALSGHLMVDGKTLYLCLNGKTLASNGTAKIQVKNGGRLVLCDCQDGGTFKGATQNVWGGACIYLYTSTLDMFGGKLTGGKVTGSGGGGAIALDDQQCIFNMYGGEISGNNGNNYGGAIFRKFNTNIPNTTGGTFNMYGGTIKDNTAKNGGAFFSTTGGTINMTGGTISGNKATQSSNDAGGGAIYMRGSGEINISGNAQITGNSSSLDGGAILMGWGTINISGSVKINNNTANRWGGAICLRQDSNQVTTLNMRGGEISGNRATKEGGAVHVLDKDCMFYLYDGKITGNTSGDGGAIYLNQEPSWLIMQGGEISGNTATGNGGGVYIYRTGSVCQLYSGKIENNKASGNGGGIYINPSNSGQLRVGNKPLVQNNTVSGKANNVYLPSGKTLTIEIGMSTGASIGVTTANTSYPVAFSNAYRKDYGKCFFADDANAHVEYKDDQKLYLVSGAVARPLTVTFDPNGGTLTDADRTKSLMTGKTYGTLPVPSYEGYDFAGWYTEQNGGTKIESDTTVTVFGTQTLYAHWTPIHVHAYTQQVQKSEALKTPADCTNNAVYYLSCKCGEISTSDTFTAENTALDHDWGAWTPIENRQHQRTCSRDSSHIETETCSYDGWTSGRYQHWHSCTVCKAELDTENHSDPNNDHKCDACGAKTSDHDPSVEIIDVKYLKSAATCITKAVYYKSCAICGEKGTDTFESGEKNPDNHAGTLGDWQHNDDTHWKVYSCCQAEAERAAHRGGTASCTAKAVCETCGSDYGELKAHDFTAETAEEQYLKSAATCTEKAVYYKSCAACGLSSKGTTDEATFESGKPLDHDWNAWISNNNGTHTCVCKHDGNHTETGNCTGGTATCTVKAVCGVCKAEYGEKAPEQHAKGCELKWITTETDHEKKYSLCEKVTIAKAAHTFGDWTITKNPTSSQTGEKERICTACQYKEIETIPATGGGSGGHSYYTIKATAGTGGAISPSGNVSVRGGRDQTFTITPDQGYAVSDVKIDGESVGVVTSYSFENVRKAHTIAVSFATIKIFVDVPAGSYYEDAVDWAVENGITQGTDDTHFSPDGICTRAQAVTFLWRAAGSPEPETRTMPFTDVPVGSYYYDAVLWAVENGITKGTSDTTFSPNMTCSRAQIVAFLWRSEKSPAAGTANPFADVKSTAYYADAVAWAVANGVTNGTTSSTFSPDNGCTRAQIVTFLYRAFNK